LLGAGAAATLGGVAAVTAMGPGQDTAPTKQWVPLAKLSELPTGQVTTVMLNYNVARGIYTDTVSTPVLVSHVGEQFTAYNSTCTHLGCTVRWDGRSEQYRCACHGGAFDPGGNVIAGPPPRPMDRYETKVVGDQLLVLV
jgi:succinate dehydrogenase / fumarate reductase iron-sulfur subunit